MDKPIYIWSVGTDERPASEEDIKAVEALLNEKAGEELQHIALNHTVTLLGVVDIDGEFHLPSANEDNY
jgi:hypothetical protein